MKIGSDTEADSVSNLRMDTYHIETAEGQILGYAPDAATALAAGGYTLADLAGDWRADDSDTGPVQTATVTHHGRPEAILVRAAGVSGHTPGPWRIGDAGHTIFGPANGNPSPETVCTLGRNFQGNARLIAAAPELLVALKHALADFAGYSGVPPEEALNDIRAAIAKAEGRA